MYGSFSSNKNASGLLCIENTIEFIKHYYDQINAGKPNYSLPPRWVNAAALMSLLKQYKNIPELRFHPKLQFSSERALLALWHSLKKNIIDYLSQRLKSHFDLFAIKGKLIPSEQVHLTHFLDSLSLMRDQLKASKDKLTTLTTWKEKLTLISEALIQTRLQLQWFDSVLKNLAFSGEEYRYLVSSSETAISHTYPSPLPATEEIPRETDIPLLKKQKGKQLLAAIRMKLKKIEYSDIPIIRSKAVASANRKEGTAYYFTNLMDLFADCREKILGQINALEEQCIQLDAFLFAKSDHSKEHIIHSASVYPTHFYQQLGVTPTATQKEIRHAYRKQALIAHPDKGGSTEQQQRINHAYEVLSSRERRALYDKKNDVIEQMFEAHTSLLETLTHAKSTSHVFDYQALHNTLQAGLQKTPISANR